MDAQERRTDMIHAVRARLRKGQVESQLGASAVGNELSSWLISGFSLFLVIQKVEEARRRGKDLMEDEGVSDLLEKALEEHEKDPVSFFDALEALLDVCDANETVEVFDYLRKKEEIVQTPSMVSQGKFHLLRSCAQLVHRLSRTENALACGAAQVYLAQFLPLYDRSGTNPAGPPEVEYPVHMDKMTDKPSGKEASTLPPVSFSFYSAFWSIQETFQKPQKLAEPSTWKNFERIVRKALVNFSSSSNTEKKGPEFRENDAWPYLTSWRITGLQLKHPTFRACFLLQALIFTEFALHPPSALIKPLPDELKSGAINLKEEILQTLHSTVSFHGFDLFLDRVLTQEKHWVDWKRSKCPNLTRKRVDDLGTDASTSTKKARIGLTEMLPGPDGFEDLEDISMGNLDSLQDKALVVPLSQFFHVVSEQEDPENAIEEPYKVVYDNIFRWRAFRRVAAEEFQVLQELESDVDAFKRYACSKSDPIHQA